MDTETNLNDKPGQHATGLRDVMFDENDFKTLLIRERKRSERTKSLLFFVAIDLSSLVNNSLSQALLASKTKRALHAASREIDIRGWYEDGRIAGIVYTDIAPESVNLLLHKVRTAFNNTFGKKLSDNIEIHSSGFPREDNQAALGSGQNHWLIYPDLHQRHALRQINHALKRVLDFTASLAGMVILSPVFAVIAIAIKLASPGPVFFKQERIGLHGRRFLMYKFRSMKVNNDPSSHKEFVQKLIQGGVDGSSCGGVFKIANDPRVTSIGAFLRKTSLDELPQLINVLKGEMSLVGPRPPIAYEVEVYDLWHVRRLFEAKPGITGLWQVEGRSRTTFEDMVRMDLRYSQRWSIWLDVKLLLKTSAVLVTGKGGY